MVQLLFVYSMPLFALSSIICFIVYPVLDFFLEMKRYKKTSESYFYICKLEEEIDMLKEKLNKLGSQK